MKNVNKYLEQELYNLLNGSLSVPLYNGYLPPVVNESGYAIIGWIDNKQDDKLFTAVTGQTIFQISIYTKDTSANPGELCDTVTDEILAILSPDNFISINLEPDIQITKMVLIDDNKPQPMTTNSGIFINRFLNYRLEIFHKQ